MCAPVEDHDVVPSLSHNIESQTHPRGSECDGRPPVQVQPNSVDRMFTSSTGVQTDLSKVVHSSCRPICHSSEPQTPSEGIIYQYFNIDRYVFLNFNIDTKSGNFNIVSITHQEEFSKYFCNLSVPCSLIINIYALKRLTVRFFMKFNCFHRLLVLNSWSVLYILYVSKTIYDS